MFHLPLKVCFGASSYFVGIRCFLGIGISVYGDFDGDTEGEMIEARIVVDNDPPVTFAPTPQQSANITNNNQYFYTDGLEQGEHTITITTLNNNTVWIDYFLVIPGDVLVTPTTTETATTTATITGVATTSTGQSINIRAIVGGTIGGISILVAFLILVVWIQRRKKQSQTLDSHLVSPSKRFIQSKNTYLLETSLLTVPFLSPSPRVSSVSLMANRSNCTHLPQHTQMQSLSALPVHTAGALLPERCVDSVVPVHELPPAYTLE